MAALDGNRLASLDFFRGATIVLMILVNAGGIAYAQFRHASWNGWTLADAVFPFFLWIMGVSMVLSFAKKTKERQSKGELLLHILRRSAMLFAIGFSLNLLSSNFNLAVVRVFGVLQRIAITYFFAGLVLLYFKPKRQAVIAVALLIAYWLLIKFMPVPGFGAGVLELGKNLPQYVDVMLLKGHTWLPTGDPEGILSTIPAISTILFGILAGRFLLSKAVGTKKVGVLFLSGLGFIAAGYVMSLWLPINKQLWTSSFAVLMAGIASVVFSVSYWIIEARGYKGWSLPFVAYGRNALFLYVLSILLVLLAPYLKINSATILFSILQLLVLYAVAQVMLAKGWFLKI